MHGVYKPGNVVLKPEVLAEGQRVASAKLGLPEGGSKPFDFVFHGGSGSLKSDIEDSLKYGVVKMNVDTDTQYAFTRPLAAHMFTNYDGGVLKIDGEVGNKKRSTTRAATSRRPRLRWPSASSKHATTCTAPAGPCQPASSDFGAFFSVRSAAVSAPESLRTPGRSSTGCRGTAGRNCGSIASTGRTP